MIEHKHRGVRFNADGNRIPVAYVDASNKQGPESGKCQYGFDIRTAGGAFITHGALLQNVGYGAPAQEHMALMISECVGHMPMRWTCATVDEAAVLRNRAFRLGGEAGARCAVGCACPAETNAGHSEIE